MSLFNDALDWVKEKTGSGQYSMPLPMEDFDDDWIPEKGHRVHISESPPKKKERKPKRSVTLDEAQSLFVKCEGCGTSQLFDLGSCNRCGSPLPEPIVPEVIEKEVEVHHHHHHSAPSVYQPTMTVAMTTGAILDFGITSSDMNILR